MGLKAAWEWTAVPKEQNVPEIPAPAGALLEAVAGLAKTTQDGC